MSGKSVVRYGAAFLCLALCLGVSGCARGRGDSSKPDNSKGQESGSSKGQSGNAKEGGGQAKSGGATGENAIELTPEQQQQAGIRVAQISPTDAPRSIAAPAQVALDEEHTAHISPVVEGRVTDIFAKPGDHVARGAVLAHLHSHAVHDTVGTIEQAMADVARRQAAVTFQQERADRYSHLYGIQAASLEESQRAQQDLLQARNELTLSEVTLHTEREHLADVLQVEPDSINLTKLRDLEDAPIRAALTGTVISRAITPGMVLEPGMEAYVVANLNTVWVVSSVNEADLGHVRRGDPVEVRSAAWGNEVFRGRVTLIGSTLDPTTRTAQVRATVPNPQGRLKPAMFATARIGEHATRPALFLPEDALQDINGVQTVFVTENGHTFTPQAIRAAPPVNHLVEILDGLKPGQNVAMTGTFILKSQLLKGSIGQD